MPTVHRNLDMDGGLAKILGAVAPQDPSLVLLWRDLAADHPWCYLPAAGQQPYLSIKAKVHDKFFHQFLLIIMFIPVLSQV